MEPNEELEEQTKEEEPKKPEVPSTNEQNLRNELDALQRKALAELHEQNRELQAKLAELNSAKQPTPEEDAKSLFENPRKLIREEMEAIVKPLLDFRNEYNKESSYEKLKRNLPASMRTIYDEVATHVDRAMATVEPTEQNFQAAIFSVYGAYKAGLIPGSTPPSPEPTKKMETPPNLPPSPPTPPKPPANSTPAKRELTESEREIAKRFNMTHEQYLEYLSAPDAVSSWKEISK